MTEEDDIIVEETTEDIETVQINWYPDGRIKAKPLTIDIKDKNIIDKEDE